MKKLHTLFFLFFSMLTFAQTPVTDDEVSRKLLLTNNRLVVLYFYADWSEHCKNMNPVLIKVANKYKDEVDFYKLDIEANELDNNLDIKSVPTLYFIKDEQTLQSVEGAMTFEDTEKWVIKYRDYKIKKKIFKDVASNHEREGEFSDEIMTELYDDSYNLNELAWHAYKEHDETEVLAQAIKMVQRSIELDKTSYNTDTYAALLYKTGEYMLAFKQAKESIRLAKESNKDYEATSDLLEKIIDKMM